MTTKFLSFWLETKRILMRANAECRRKRQCSRLECGMCPTWRRRPKPNSTWNRSSLNCCETFTDANWRTMEQLATTPKPRSTTRNDPRDVFAGEAPFVHLYPPFISLISISHNFTYKSVYKHVQHPHPLY